MESKKIAIEYTIKLITYKIILNSIEGINSYKGCKIEKTFKNFDNWVRLIRIIVKQKKVIIQMMIQVHTNTSVFKLYKEAKDLCEHL